jgi:hypothetical protein
MRLNVITPSSNGNPAARIYELEVYGESSRSTASHDLEPRR